MSTPALTATASIKVPNPSQLIDVAVTGPLSATFTANVTGGTPPYTYKWNFGDGTTGSGITIDHSFPSNGTYLVELTVQDSTTPSPIETVVPLPVVVSGVAPPPLSVTATASPPSGPEPLDVTLNATVAGGTAPYTYAWDLGDGNTASGPTVTHVYNNAGTYDAVVTVTDSSTPPQTATGKATVTVSSASFSATLAADPTTGPAPLTVKFTGTIVAGTGPYRYWLSFGDGSNVHGSVSGSTVKASHIYSGKVKFQAGMSVTDSTGKQIHANTVWITLT